MGAREPQNRPLPAVEGQLDLAGNLDRTARYDELEGAQRLKLFEPAPVQIAGQTYMDTEREDESC